MFRTLHQHLSLLYRVHLRTSQKSDFVNQTESDLKQSLLQLRAKVALMIILEIDACFADREAVLIYQSPTATKQSSLALQGLLSGWCFLRMQNEAIYNRGQEPRESSLTGLVASSAEERLACSLFLFLDTIVPTIASSVVPVQ